MRPRLRVLVVVLSLDREPWRGLEQAQRETWARAHPGLEIVYLQGVARGLMRSAFLAVRRVGASFGLQRVLDRLAGRLTVHLRVRRFDDVVRTQTPEYWIGTSVKMQAGLRFLVRRFEFDYLVRTNSSTYLNLPRLVDYLADAPRERFYAGPDSGRSYAQGTCIVLSRDVAVSMAHDRQWAYDEVDDAAIGAAALRASAVRHALVQTTVRGPEELASLEQSQLDSSIVVRIKSPDDRESDRQALFTIHRMMDTES